MRLFELTVKKHLKIQMQFNFTEARQDLYKSSLMKFKRKDSQEEWRQ